MASARQIGTRTFIRSETGRLRSSMRTPERAGMRAMAASLLSRASSADDYGSLGPIANVPGTCPRAVDASRYAGLSRLMHDARNMRSSVVAPADLHAGQSSTGPRVPLSRPGADPTLPPRAPRTATLRPGTPTATPRYTSSSVTRIPRVPRSVGGWRPRDPRAQHRWVTGTKSAGDSRGSLKADEASRRSGTDCRNLDTAKQTWCVFPTAAWRGGKPDAPLSACFSACHRIAAVMRT